MSQSDTTLDLAELDADDTLALPLPPQVEGEGGERRVRRPRGPGSSRAEIIIATVLTLGAVAVWLAASALMAGR